jgi:hypothetical protein
MSRRKFFAKLKSKKNGERTRINGWQMKYLLAETFTHCCLLLFLKWLNAFQGAYLDRAKTDEEGTRKMVSRKCENVCQCWRRGLAKL